MLRATLSRPSDEDDRPTEPPFDWHRHDDDSAREVLGEYVGERGARHYRLVADAPPGRTLFAEQRPLFALSLQSERQFRASSYLYDLERTVHYKSAIDADPLLKTLPDSRDWFFVFSLLGRHGVAELALRLPAAGKHSRVALLLRSKLKLNAVELAWINAIRKRHPAVSWREALTAYSLVVVNAMHVRSEITGVMYAVALYDETSALAHSCSPSGRVHYERDGSLRVVATRALARGDVLTINRYLPPTASLLCVQLAPETLRRSVQSVVGRACRCTLCVERIAALRRYADGSLADAEATCVTVERLWRDGVDEERAALELGADSTELTTPLDPYLANTPTSLLTGRGERLRAVWALGGRRSVLPLELALLVLRVALLNPLLLERDLGSETLKAACAYVLGDGARALADALARQCAPDAERRRLHAQYAATAYALAFGVSTLVPLLDAASHDEPAPPAPSDEQRRLLDETERALLCYVFAGAAEVDGAALGSPTTLTAVARVLSSIYRHHSIFFDALRYVSGSEAN